MHDQLGLAAKGGVGDRVEVADDHIGTQTHLEQRVGPTVDRNEHRPEVADVGTDDPEIRLDLKAR
jgi:hypothetical protein